MRYFDPIKGEKIVAFVILKDGTKPEDIENELKKTVKTHLGSYAVPSKIVIVHKLPKTKSGKILRRILKNLIEGKDLGNISTLNEPSCLEELSEICQRLNREFYPNNGGQACQSVTSSNRLTGLTPTDDPY